MEHRECIIGCLVGTAVGDSVGLPAEGLSRARVARRFPGPWRQRLAFGRGMLSDDTEHSLMVAQALLAGGGEVDRTRRSLAWRLRWWLLGLPAGAGLSTTRAIVKLWLGWPSRCSGVRSAGNGAAMRSAVLGVVFAEDDAAREAMVRACSAITHRETRAITGALAVAEAAAWLARTPEEAMDIAALWRRLRAIGEEGDHRWHDLIDHLAAAWDEQHDVDEVAGDLGLERGVSGYVYHSVPVALYAALHHLAEPRAALEAVWRCGGDTDTVGAITGALLGAAAGPNVFPAEWRERLCDWPRSLRVLERAGARLAGERATWHPVRYPWPLLPLRNLVFLTIVLGHGLRRLLPPY